MYVTNITVYINRKSQLFSSSIKTCALRVALTAYISRSIVVETCYHNIIMISIKYLDKKLPLYFYFL